MATSNEDLKIVFSILKFLKDKSKSAVLSEEKKESLDVSLMCLQEVFEMEVDNPDHQAKYSCPQSLQELFSDQPSASAQTPDRTQEAEKLKNQGNLMMKEGKQEQAIDLYSQALGIDSSNPTYYANRAAAYMKMNKFENALQDCHNAVSLNPQYAKVYVRMGVIHQKMNQLDKAKEMFQRAVELEPDSDEYQSHLKSVEQQASAAAGGGGGGGGGGGEGGGRTGSFPLGNLGDLMNSPMFMNLATSVMSNPGFQNVASRLMQSQTAAAGGGGGGGGPGGMNMSEMMPELSQMAQQMQQNNPEMFETLRSQAAQFKPHHDDQLPPNEKK